MERIASFTVDHTQIKTGMYLSRIDFLDIITYDIRMKEPNKGDYLSTGAAHTMEHLFATYARNSQYGAQVLYIGPMGCRTGFYLLTKGLPHAQAIQLVRDSMAFIQDFEGEIPGATEAECGNYLDQDLQGARQLAGEMAEVLTGWNVDKLEYEAYLD